MGFNPIHIIFGLKLRQARLAKGLSVTELAERSQLSPSYITEIEKGRKYPKADKIMRLAEALGWRYGGAFDPQRRPPPGGCYLVPDETLTCAQARHLGIRDEDDLFGGVVPHPFVASKVITHPLPGADAAAPPG